MQVAWFDLHLPRHTAGSMRLRFYPLWSAAGGSPVIPTLILIGALDEWTPAADCSDKIDAWGTDGPPIELVVYPGVHHSFYYPELQPGRKVLGYWVEYDA